MRYCAKLLSSAQATELLRDKMQPLEKECGLLHAWKMLYLQQGGKSHWTTLVDSEYLKSLTEQGKPIKQQWFLTVSDYTILRKKWQEDISERNSCM